MADTKEKGRKSYPWLSTGLKYGITGGVLAIVFFLVMWLLKENPLGMLRLFDFVILPVFIFFTLKEFRDYRQGGKLTYSQGMTVSFVCYTSLALISALFIFIFLTYADTGLLLRHQQENLAVLTDDSQRWIDELGQQTYDKAIEEVKRTSALDLALDDLIKKIFIGLFLTGIITLFLKK
ncbi:hypothetical protein D770_21475 [Flammeovirgaceae bacterium 311]|nr:hypothetical protein D770_21475 [Flammeovirgaceae bacterium 311]